MPDDQQVNLIARKFANILLEAGYKMMKSAFHLEPKEVEGYVFSSFLRSKAPSVNHIFLDGKYYLIPFSQWLDIIQVDWINLLPWITETFDCKVPEDLAFAYGLFFTDGTCGFRKKEKGYRGAYWRIVNSNLDYLNRAKDALDWEYKDKLCFVIRQYPDYQKGQKTNYGERKKTLYCLDAKRKDGIAGNDRKNIKGKFIEEWREMFYDYLTNLKKTPKQIHDKYPTSRKAFLEGVIAGDGAKGKNRYISVGIKNKRAVCEVSTLMETLNWKMKIKKFLKEFRIYYNTKTEEMRSLNCDDHAFAFSSHISEMFDINSKGAVYGRVLDKNTGKEVGWHYWNAIVSKEQDGSLHLYHYEPGTDQYAEDRGGQIIIGNWIYEPKSIQYF